jgi:hypothetical protein
MNDDPTKVLMTLANLYGANVQALVSTTAGSPRGLGAILA